MATDYQKAIGRAVTDASFRARLLKTPRQTLAKEGYVVEDALIAKLEAVDPAAAEAAAKDLEHKFGDGKSAF